MANREDRILERLRMQKAFLEAARQGHLLWSKNTQDLVLRNEHLEIADLLEHIAKQFLRLIEGYHGRAR